MAAPLGKLEFYIVDPTTGLPVSGASVEIRKQGATVSGITDPQIYVVDNPGGIETAAESAVVYQPGGAVRDSSVRGVTTVTATGVVVAAPGFSGVVDDDRISPTTDFPTLSEDAQGNESKSNPLTTDVNGFAYAWVPINLYDAKVTKAGVLTERLLIDQPAFGIGAEESWVFGTGTQVVHQRDTNRSLLAGDKLDRWLHLGSEKMSIDEKGQLVTAEKITITAGGLTVTAGGILVSVGQIQLDDAASQIVAGATSLALRNNADNADNLLITDAGIVTTRLDSIALRDSKFRHLLASEGTAVVTGDFSLGSGWGTGSVVTSVTNATNTAGRVRITTGTGLAGNQDFTFTFKEGGYTGNPHTIFQRAGGVINGNIGIIGLITMTGTTVTVTLAGPLADSTAYDFEWITIR